ncbi:MAG TPA: acyl-CoA dehydrogenase [Verrucomicrobiae bacterium]|nr:acyl-CoA dehydrogenase [Verrucomicrobiae bacterium]
MNFTLTQEQQAIRNMVREFAVDEIAPRAAEIDKSGEFPMDLVKKMADLDLFGLPFPEEVGGAGADYVSYALAVEEVSRVCASTGITYAAHVSLGCMPLFLFGTDEQKNKWLRPMIKGEFMGAFGLTEPNAGSDAGGTQTHAVLDGDEWVINGSKCFITNASYAGAVTVTAVTDKEKKTNGISAIIIPKGTPGFTVSSNYDKLGLKGSNTCELSFDNVRVPKENLLGERGLGFKQFLKILDGGRISIAALSVGIGQACVDASVKYARERKQFGQPLMNFQAIQFKLADMSMHMELARLMYLKAAWMRDHGMKYGKEAAMAKLFGSEKAMEAATQAIQIHGGYGYMKEYPVERYFRDVKLMEIGEGTSEVQRMVIARHLNS